MVTRLSGIGVLLFGLAGWVVLEGVADRPETNVDPAAFLSYFADRDAVVLGSFLIVLSAACLLWFLGPLRAELQRIERGSGHLTAVAYGAGVATATLMLGLPAMSVLGALYAGELSGDAAKTLFIAGDVLVYPASLTAAVLVGATALVELRRAVRWPALVSLAYAAWLLVPPLSGGGDVENPAWWSGLSALVLLPAWIAVVAALLAWSARDGSA